MFGGAYDYILVGTRDSAGDNRFYVLNVADGTSAHPPVDGSGVTDFGRIGIISGQASVDYAGRRVYFTSYARGAAPNDRTVWSVNLDDGTVVWAQAYGDIAAGPTLNGDGTRLYVGTNTGEVKALDTSDGTVAWSYPTGDGPVKGFVFFDRFSLTNDLYFATTGTLWSIADSGGTPPTFRWSRTLDSPSTPVFLRGPNHVYVGLGDGTLHRLNSADGSDAPGIPVTFPLTLGDGSANVGSPTIDIVGGFLYVGTVGGVVYAVELIP
jgi:outer membrane protein assembly factor BamB